MYKRWIVPFAAALMLFGVFGTATAASNFAPDPAGPMPSEQLNSQFTIQDIVVDGKPDAAYDAAVPSRIAHGKNAAATADLAADTYGELRSVWDGPVLYLLVQVHDKTKSRSAATDTGLRQDDANNPAIRDSVVFMLDFWNDKVDKFQDDDGIFTVSSNGNLTYEFNTAVNNHSSVHAYPQDREYTNRIKSYAATDTPDGYNVELALQIEGAKLQNGTKFGVDVAISDSPAEGVSRTGYVFWSHDNNAYTALSQDHSVDWGTVMLAGWNGTDPFKFSDWVLRNTIRWVESPSLVKGVWTPATESELNAALAAAKATVGSTDQAAVDAAAKRLQDAIAALRWADTKYPDPMDLPSQFTLPDPWTYFDGSKVKSKGDWFRKGGRRDEILDLAQFYEYGYKPGAPDKMSITDVAPVPASPGVFVDGIGYIVPPSPAGLGITVSMTYGKTTAPITFTLYPPTEEAKRKAGHKGPVPVVMSFGGFIPEYSDAGYAVLAVPPSVTTDDRNDPWGARSGTFRTFFPYTRNGDPLEISNEMGAAWGASRAIDALELLSKSGNKYGKGVNKLIDPGKLAVTGHSIYGKYAFVSAVFDDRIDVCIPSAAGATGPSPYRYVYIGHQYSWGTASGTEMLGDTIRHNPGRTTELFRRFLTPGRFYERLDGAWGYGDRIPFDQHELVATLAPRAIVLHNTVNDYGDGAESDPLGLEAAKFVYKTLGYDADDLVKFNVRPFAATREHAEDTPQRQRTAEYLDHYFYGKKMPPETDAYLNDDPFDDQGAKAENAYNRYFGGYATLAPWKDYKFPGKPDHPGKPEHPGKP
ncbi:sugar-binding protein [Paenibacillus humicola]|uniref:glucuronyl esterase domain-containing protein n=1 Tax=Paenibacillus humicola TaxID=3110540 RepID=UPI00237B93C6|nr:sugar-binding protein [Paenibacillus humicola]